MHPPHLLHEPIVTSVDIRKLEAHAYPDTVPFQSTVELLAHASAEFRDRPALIFAETDEIDRPPLTWTFAELWQDVRRAGNLFRKLGVERDQPVALLVPHIPSAHVALWGAQLAGCAFPINYLLQPDHIAHLLATTGTRVLVTLGPAAGLGIHETACRAAQLSGCITHILVIDADEATYAPDSFQAQVAQQQPDLAYDPGLRRDTLAALYHTGGTTGLPKILRHEHGCEVHTSWFATRYYDMGAGDIILNGFPLFHVAGTFVYGLSALSRGAAILLPTLTGMRNQAFVHKVWQFADRHAITHFGCVPTVLSTILESPREAGQGRSVRLALTGGSPLPNELALKFSARTGVPVRNIFGMTECVGVVSIEPSGSPRRPGSVGMRLPYTDVRAIPFDSDLQAPLTRFCEVDEPGILVIRGPHVSGGYLDTARNPGTFTVDGWLVSGDIGYVDRDGYIFLTGRSKDLIIRSGHNIEPGVIEDAFLSNPAVSTCAAVGEPDAYAGELPVVFVALVDGAEATPDALLAEAVPLIPERPAVPKKVVVLQALPVTPVGKVYKPALRALAAQAKMEELLAAAGLSQQVSVACSAEQGALTVVVSPVPAADADRVAAACAVLSALPVTLEVTNT